MQMGSTQAGQQSAGGDNGTSKQDAASCSNRFSMPVPVICVVTRMTH